MEIKNGILKISTHNICILLFIISLVVLPGIIMLYMGLLYLTYKEKIMGAIKSLIIITFRGILSTAGSYDTMKLFVIFILSLYILYKSFDVNKKVNRITVIVFSIFIFCIYIIIASFISGSYPVTSFFKIVSFFITFVAVIEGIYITKEKIDWLEYLCKWLTILMITSFFLLPFDSFKTINNNFQGVFNHVNVLGVIGALYISLLLVKNESIVVKNKLAKKVLIIMTLIMQYYTLSRTGLIISCICLFVNFITNTSIKKIIYISVIFLSCFIVYTTNDTINTQINNELISFIYKGNQSNILASRRDIQKDSQLKYENNELLGSGFMLPFEKNVRDYSLNLGKNYEPSNLIWMLIGDTGQIGVLLFLVFTFLLIINGQIKYIILVISSFGICMGEMVFFSVNNFSIIIYTILSIYLIKKN
ncbi:O-antigen ligase family protein [Thomasclavelia cocleata]|uniref:O-antigen ligase family protein n=1 Tax=Thomasclavelia cocleata TaxID=69824 RepID=UPI0025AC9436|nr:O-antigen ligase family protein [Thomasclavelia cocleata]